MHSIVCEPWQRDARMYECRTELYRAMHAWWTDDCDEWQWWYVVRSFLWTSDGEEMSNWMNACKHGWTDSCLCVFVYVYVVGWLVRVTCLQGGAVYITGGSSGTFTNCNFTSNSSSQVSLEEGHVDGCMWYVWVHYAEVVPSIYVFLTDWLTDSFLLSLSVYCDCFL